MSNVELHDRANELFGSVLSKVPADGLAAPSPCVGWAAKDVIDHVTGGNRMLAWAAKGQAFPTGGEEAAVHHVDDAVAAFRASAEDAKEAWAREGIGAEMIALPWGTMPGEVAIGIHFVDVLVHSWDLACAAGVDLEVPDDLAEPALAMASGFPDSDDMRGEGKPFRARVDVPDDAPTFDRLLGLTGRRPA